MANKTEQRTQEVQIAGLIEQCPRPRFAMAIAMTILSVAILEPCTGLPAQDIRPSAPNPMRIWDRAEDKVIRVKDRALKYYENIRLVYEIERQLKDLQEEQETSGQQREPVQHAGRSAMLAGAGEQFQNTSFAPNSICLAPVP